ncbi:protein saal1 [Galendromus occidentalis]|uniref:Protein saal1 n=1 Tax=Galendromus occidentalis TaxID=34638 RepID=A0AAJ7SES4_9ACAR|nr:protein saal1 [Galendromus occidentalis]
MDEDDRRNPSPPPGLEEFASETTIGDTTFSKSWLFQILMDTIKEGPQPRRDEDGDAEMVNLSEDIEERLCILWDISANQEVSAFLLEFDTPTLFVGLISPTKSPRLVEILVGILGNMCTFEEICEPVSKTDCLVRVCLWLLGSTDVPTLLQLCRLLQTCLAHRSASAIWIDSIRDNLAPTVDHLQHILCNSMNGDLLSSTLRLVHRIVDTHSSVKLATANLEFVRALTSAAMQFLSRNDVLRSYWHILYTLECETQFAPLLDLCVDDFVCLLKAFLASLPDDSTRAERYQLLCLPYSFLASLTDKGRHLLLDDSAVSECTFQLLHEMREPLPEDDSLRDTLEGALSALTRGVAR